MNDQEPTQTDLDRLRRECEANGAHLGLKMSGYCVHCQTQAMDDPRLVMPVGLCETKEKP